MFTTSHLHGAVAYPAKGILIKSKASNNKAIVVWKKVGIMATSKYFEHQEYFRFPEKANASQGLHSALCLQPTAPTALNDSKTHKTVSHVGSS